MKEYQTITEVSGPLVYVETDAFVDDLEDDITEQLRALY